VTSFVSSLRPPHFSTSPKQLDFRKKKKVTELEMCVLIFSTTFVYSISYSKKILVRYCHKCEKSSCKNTRYSHRILTKLEVSPQIFVKKLRYKVSSKSAQSEPSCSMRTDRRDEALSRFSQFRERA
jgi:hypothetical protein